MKSNHICFQHRSLTHLALAMSLLLGAWDAAAVVIRVGVAQTEIEDTLPKNLEKILRLMGEAKSQDCDLVVFCENGLHWPDIAIDNPTNAEIDAALDRIRKLADEYNQYVVFSSRYTKPDGRTLNCIAGVYDPEGGRPVQYWKNEEVPDPFTIKGAPANLSICSDRWYLELSDLPCLAAGTQIIIDTSGGHGGDDGRPTLRWLRYRPWAERTGAYVIVCNPVHLDTDFMGNSPWGGGSAIVRPDGTLQASLTFEKDVLMVEEIDTDLARRVSAQRRMQSPVLAKFWEAGRTLLETNRIEPAPDVVPLVSEAREIKIAAAQMACSRDIDDNAAHIVDTIRNAAKDDADIVVFPELALTGACEEDLRAATQPVLDAALDRIRYAAKEHAIYAIVGTPGIVDGTLRNCAVVIGDDGSVLTRYAQIAETDSALFTPSDDVAAMWFMLKGVHCTVAIGEDASWVELGDLAANRGMCLRFHISYAADATEEAALLRRQRDVQALSYAQFGASVNAADPSALARPSAPASGGSLVVNRVGGHNQQAPAGVEAYFPYATSIVDSAGAGEAMLSLRSKTSARNSRDLEKFWMNRNRKSRNQNGYYDWIKLGTSMIGPEPVSKP